MSSAAERAFRAINRQEGQYAILLDAEFTILWQSDSLARILGYDDIVGRNSTEFIHPDDLELASTTLAQINAAGDLYSHGDARYAPAAADMRVIDAWGEWHHMECTTFDYLDDPEISAVLCTSKLIRDRSDVARSIELLATGADMESVLEVVARLADRSVGASTRVAVAWREGEVVCTTTAPDEEVMDVELAAVAGLVWRLGLRTPLLIDDLGDPRLGPGTGVLAASRGFRGAYLVPIEAPATTDIIGAMVLWGVTSVDFDTSMQAPIHLAMRLAALAIADSRSKRALRWAASHDPLTGLANRAEFERRMQAVAHTDVVLLYIDLDDFKPINDVHGHPVGDSVLVEVGKRITGVLGPNDFVGRLGGDEFALVCTTDDLDRARNVAERVISEVRRPILANGAVLRVGASVGMAVGIRPLIPALLVQRADEALYAAKHSGKNTVRVAS